MSSYGFGPNDRGWNESKKGILANTLRGLIDDMEGEGKFIGLTLLSFLVPIRNGSALHLEAYAFL